MKQKLHEGWTLEMPGGRPWARGQNITYARRFTPDEGMLDCGELILCLESTGGIAGITLNGTPLTDPNVPIPHELTVTCLVHKGINTLLISLQPGRIPEPRPDISLPVTLLGQEGARINDVSITQTRLDGSIQLRLGVSAVSSGNLELAASLTDPRGTGGGRWKIPSSGGPGAMAGSHSTPSASRQKSRAGLWTPGSAESACAQPQCP